MTPPTSQSSVIPQSQESTLELVSTATQNSATLSSVTNTTTEHSSTSETLTTTVSAPRSLYEPPMSTRLNPVIPPHTPSHNTQQFVNSHLPKLTLPMFSGDPLTWQIFWDSYVSIHANPNLSHIQKFTYLKAQLQGDAARASAGLLGTTFTQSHY